MPLPSPTLPTTSTAGIEFKFILIPSTPCAHPSLAPHFFTRASPQAAPARIVNSCLVAPCTVARGPPAPPCPEKINWNLLVCPLPLHFTSPGRPSALPLFPTRSALGCLCLWPLSALSGPCFNSDPLASAQLTSAIGCSPFVSVSSFLRLVPPNPPSNECPTPTLKFDVPSDCTQRVQHPHKPV